jgi:hypothetical protein
MRLRYKLITIAAVGLNVFLTNCKIPPPYVPPTLPTISPQLTSVAINSTTTFTVAGTDANLYSSWSFTGFVPSNSWGTLSTNTGQTTTYTAPAAPPIYPGVADTTLQGKVRLVALVSGTGSTELDFFITAPTVTTGISPTAASVTLGNTAQFFAYAVGSTNNALTFQVNGVAGGNPATGTISALGLYTAPTTMPVTGSTVTITAISTSDPTKTSAATITLH